MGKELSEEEKNKVAWDTNAITPGTPFMDLLAASLRYWVVSKMNTDDGWKGVRFANENTITFQLMHLLRFKLLYLMQVFQVKVNTRSWTGSVASAQTPDMIQIRDTLSTA